LDGYWLSNPGKRVEMKIAKAAEIKTLNIQQ